MTNVVKRSRSRHTGLHPLRAAAGTAILLGLGGCASLGDGINTLNQRIGGDGGAVVSRYSPSVLNPQGPGAQSIVELWWLMFGLGTVIYLGVMGLALLSLRRRRSRQASDDTSLFTAPDRDEAPRGSHRLIMFGGLALPGVVLTILLIATVRAATPVTAAPQPLVIEVIGHQFWWEVRYPDHEIITANEIYIPTGEPVQFRLTTNDVIHSFWVPELHGKMDMIPGRTNVHWIQADNPGTYRGICAEFCGLQHALMAFYVVATSPSEFAGWIERQRQPASAPNEPLTARGQQVYITSNCAYCHAIRGVIEAQGIGPDLTHFGSRLTIGAGTLDNNAGNLGGWISNAQTVKPGNHMPPIQLTGEDLNALIAYLHSLR